MNKYSSLFVFIFFFAVDSASASTFISASKISPLKSSIKLQNYDQLFSLTQTSKTQNQNSKSAVERGKIRFEAGQFVEAANIWQQATIEFERQGDTFNQAWILSYLSLAYQNMGDWKKAETAINNSLKLLQRYHSSSNSEILAVALNTQGRLKLSTGQAGAALKCWQEAEQAYAATGDIIGEVGSKINQAQALQTMGLYSRAKKLLQQINQQLQQQQDLPLKLKALRSLGVAMQVIGDLNESKKTLKDSLEISQKLGLVGESSEILFSLGNTKRSLQDIQAALNYYQQAAALATNPQVKVEALLNQFSLYVETSQNDSAETLIPQIATEIATLPPSRISIYAKVNFARNLLQLAPKNQQNSQKYQQAVEILTNGIKQAENLGDMRAKAYALIQLSKLNSRSQQYDSALKWSQQALKISQELNAADISYQAAWQVGRISNKLGDKENASAAYKFSIENLKLLRSDLVAMNSNVQFSFQESVEPVYREYVSLLLEESNPGEQKLREARELIEALQLAELDNFFREACIDTKPENIDRIDTKAAVIYPIILPDRLEVILSVGNKSISKYRVILPQAEIEKAIQLMRQSLNPTFSNQERSQVSQQLYNWLIRPAEAELSRHQIETLVFVLDGSLRNLPMAGLYDGKQYLIEKYNTALSPGLQIMRSQLNKVKNRKLIVAGLSEARQNFKPLPAVKSEVLEIASTLPSTKLLNEDFTDSKLKNAIKSTPFTILHLATHGQFSSKSEETFIVTWDGKINVKELDELLKMGIDKESVPVELMVLSACQTAKGDNRAILGLAGVAVRSGARSTLATLWAVKDESTAKFMIEFYKQLSTPGISKAGALRNTQLAFLKDANKDFQHPFYWASFVLIGNWL
ncbi:MAG: CHAT domain-containing protein [Methylacidiphilales bacterium]|nr:CHAT domain-containing protein [Candidatus Methylacidiphilales bacterium]NJR14408.1 CHAT domain-containing protein [Calothrix sp. CSU_2_0]